MTEPNQLAVVTLIQRRVGELGLKRTDLVRRAGLKNITKGLRRLDQLKRGELGGAVALLRGLPAALELPAETVHAAIRETEEQIARAEEADEKERDRLWRAQFQPSAFLVGEHRRPTQITGASARFLRIALDLTQPETTFASQALAVARRTPMSWPFGPTKGFIVNFTPDRAVHFDLNANPVEYLNRAYVPDRTILGKVPTKIARSK